MFNMLRNGLKQANPMKIKYGIMPTSFKEMKTSLKYHKELALAGDKNAGKFIAVLTDKMEDLKDVCYSAALVPNYYHKTERMNFNCRNCGANDIQNNKCKYCQTKYA